MSKQQSGYYSHNSGRSESRSRSVSRSRSRERRRISRSSSRSFGSHSRSSSRSRRSRSRSLKPRYVNNNIENLKYGRRDDPEPSRCLGVFGLSMYTTERDLKEMFGKFGDLESVQIVYDHPTGRSRGFGFVYFKNVRDAAEAKERIVGTEIDGHRIRVDFSITKRAHTPTPGIYMGATDSRKRVHRRRRSGSYRARHDSPKYSSHNSRRYDDRRSPYRSRYDGGHRRSPPSPRYYNNRRSSSPRHYDRRHRRSHSRDKDY